MGLPRPTDYENLVPGITQLVDALEMQVSLLAVPRSGSKIATGTGSAVWTASQFSATAVVSHGLGATPVFWSAFSVDAGQVLYYFTGAAPTSTTLTFQGAATGVVSFTRTFTWLAIS